jgi:molybdopterin molybdotransferase
LSEDERRPNGRLFIYVDSLYMLIRKANAREERLLSFEDARQLVMEHAEQELAVERERHTSPLLESLGRVLAEDIHADRDLPPFARATRDGFAVHSEDLRDTPAVLKLAGEIRAGGDVPAGFTRLKRMQAISIMTGAPVPDGADAVVMVEHTQPLTEGVRVLRSVAAGENVVPRGSEARVGALLVERGTVISHAHVAVTATVGKSLLSVYAKPIIAILPTGDELVSIETRPGENQIRNSNSFSIAAQVIAAGGEPVQLPIAADQSTRLQELIAQGLESDLLLLSGGVSAGEYDLVEDVLSEFSAEFLFTGVQIQPGKPLLFGRIRSPHSSSGWTYFFGLPGNPISTMVTFALFARIMVRALSGALPMPLRGTRARLAKAVHTKTGLTRFLPARLSGSWNDSDVEVVKWQGSGDIAAFAKADCLLVIPSDREKFAPGELMTVLPL